MATQAARVAASRTAFRDAFAARIGIVRPNAVAHCARCLDRFTPTTSSPYVCAECAKKPIRPQAPPPSYEPYWRTSEKRPLTDYGGLIVGSSLSAEFPARTKL